MKQGSYGGIHDFTKTFFAVHSCRVNHFKEQVRNQVIRLTTIKMPYGGLKFKLKHKFHFAYLGSNLGNEIL